ncbi:MAG TPA: M48 family metallopeptidase [Ramlibacter sp.]|uniref:M48 family metallopeptidase n=1 Tax=Ramlibacter sp. TaxID=1917967 RepID=UPI002D7F7A6F|nr:M48 family metallopeptidase [Ramlibacter sp.]HET8744430.1 M48 family metallopeptidase [Ramlibacter sp.]
MHAVLRGAWFDGRSSRAREVQVRVQRAAGGPTLLLQALDGGPVPPPLRERDIDLPEAWSRRRAPRKVVVDLRAHGSLEIEDVVGWQAALQQAGHKAPLAQRMQTRWSAFLLVAVLAVAALLAFYRWGTPWAATQLTRHVPLEWELGLSQRVLTDMDGAWLHPSKLPGERRAALRARFDALAAQVAPALRRYPGYAPKLALQFRSGMPPNAFALPGGTIVLTDALVQEAARHGLPDDALIGVLAHEIGHVMHRHTTRMVVEQGVLNIGLGLALGDVSTLVSTGASLLTGLAYRRSHETEADCFAAALLRQAGLPAGPMADLLLGLGARPDRDKAAARQGPAWMDLLSSHPDTVERARGLKEGHAGRCV